jgi:hypothetical protein
MSATTGTPVLPGALKRKKTNKISQLTQQTVDEDPPARSEGEEPNNVRLDRNAIASDPHDEVPIGKKGPSTFEELLERELAKDQASRLAAVTAPSQGDLQPSRSVSKSSFLRRGV